MKPILLKTSVSDGRWHRIGLIRYVSCVCIHHDHTFAVTNDMRVLRSTTPNRSVMSRQSARPNWTRMDLYRSVHTIDCDHDYISFLGGKDHLSTQLIESAFDRRYIGCMRNVYIDRIHMQFDRHQSSGSHTCSTWVCVHHEHSSIIAHS